MRKDEQPASNLVPIRATGSRPPLFWIHGDASNALVAKVLESDQPLFAFKHQGRHGERVLHTDVESMAAHYLSQVFTVQPAGPYFVGGYSFGGTVAFEMARQARQQGQAVAFLFIIDSLSPGTRTRTHDRASVSVSSVSVSVSAAGTERARESSGSSVEHHLHQLSQLSLKAMAGYVLVRLNGKLKDLATKVTRALKGVLLPAFLATGRKLPFPLRSTYILRVYFDAIARYSPSPFVGRAIYIKSEQREPLHSDEWKTLLLEGLDVHEVPGCDHREIIHPAHAPVWLAILKTSLLQAQEAAGREGNALSA